MSYLKKLTTSALLVLMGAGFTANAQIPVTDSASIGARAVQHAESLAKYLEQISTLKQQLESANKQFAALTGNRNLGEILQNPAIRKSLPQDVQEILKSGENSLGSIQQSVKRIKSEERLTGDFTIDNKSLKLRMEDLSTRTKAIYEQAQEGMQGRVEQIDNLQKQINLTQDPKAIADLQARLQVEQANIQADQIRADLLSRQLDAEKALIEEQAAKLVSQSSLSINAIRAPLPNMR